MTAHINCQTRLAIKSLLVVIVTPPNMEGTPGHIRGYDVRTGKLLWTFHTIPQADEFGNETWEKGSWKYTGNTGVWTMMSADLELGYVYLPVETPTHDFYGGHRLGNNLFGESIVCLNAKTGKQVWHFQIVHQLNETVSRIDVESATEAVFVNSSLPQFGESLLLAVRWSKAIHQSNLEDWKASLHELADAIQATDAEVFQRQNSYWPIEINYALDHEPGFLEIIADPKRSKPRF